MAQSWNWKNLTIKENGGWSQVGAYVKEGGEWVYHIPYIAGDFEGTMFHMRVGEYKSGHSIRGYDPYVDPAWFDSGDLTPDVMYGFTVWRFNKSSSRVLLNLTGSSAGDPESILVTFDDNTSYPMVHTGGENWESTDQTFIDRFAADDLYFSINDGDSSTPPLPPAGDFEYTMNIGEYSSGSKIRGYDGYGSTKYGSITPDEFKGEFIRRFRTGSSGDLTILYMAGNVTQGSVTVEFSTGESFVIPASGTQSEYRSTDRALWEIFQNMDIVEFNLI